jgi:hypothetical protein
MIGTATIVQRGLATVLAALLSGLAPGLAPNGASEPLAREFRIDFEATRGPRGTTVEGYVYNQHNWSTDRMVLRIEHLDVSGKTIGSTRTWLPSGIAAGHRAYFRARVPDAPSHRVHVESFEWLRCGSA